MAEIILPMVVDKLASFIQNEVGLQWGVTKDMEKLASTLSTIQAVLEDAEQKQHLEEHKAVKDWLRKIKYASYEVDDLLDDFANHEAIPLESRPRKKVRLADPTSYPVVGNFVFGYKIGKRMSDVMERLEQIANERNNYHLRDNILVDKRGEFPKGRETGSRITEPQVLGRDEDKEKIIKILISDVADCEDVSVYPIIGMGGLGKTTLAQLVYNDERVASHFEKRIWVCVSNDFEQTKVLKAIIESESRSACQVSSLDALQTRIREMLNGKRYLLVLDDVWNEDQEKWNQLKGILYCGSRGASIITTTRHEKVALIMGTLPPHQLKVLSEEDCWDLFKQRACGSAGDECPNNLEAIGREIVKKCGGVPLAAKTLGSLLRFKREERHWRSIRDSEIWKLPQDDETSILPALRLSYYNLPLELRRCFAYCAVYEKDTIIEKDDLIHLWMANGFISSKQDMEDIGNEIWTELYMRSFFQDVEEYEDSDKVTFKMHDLVHDLAQSVMEEECQIVEVIDERPTDDHMTGKRVRHLNLIARSKPLTTIPKELHIVDSSLRTLICTAKQYMTNSPELLSIFENYGTLRAFATSKSARNLASSIGGLKHLRYLKLGGGGITTLPDSICNLWNLQTLNLEGCYNLKRLPKMLRCLKKLRHLLTPYGLIKMPPLIGGLTYLKTLTTFLVGKRRGCGLDELQHLKLGGSLFIGNLERVGNWMDAKKANLIAKENLHFLSLSWKKDNEETDSQENVLEALQPPPNLKTLDINNFKGTHFPLWMEDYSNLKSLVTLRLSCCRNCLQLPPLQQLPSLKYLEIGDVNYVEYMIINGDNNYELVQGGTGNAIRGFQYLESLQLRRLRNLKGLSNEDEGRGLLFPRLRYLYINDCPELTNLPQYCFPALEELSISEQPELTSMSDLKGLSNEKEGRGPLFPKLKNLHINDCPKLTNLPRYCFPALEELSISEQPELTSMSDWLESLTSLRSLLIRNCPKLTSIPPNYFRNLTKLQRLNIWRCPELAKRYKVGTGEDWHMIAHIPDVSVW